MTLPLAGTLIGQYNLILSYIYNVYIIYIRFSQILNNKQRYLLFHFMSKGYRYQLPYDHDHDSPSFYELIIDFINNIPQQFYFFQKRIDDNITFLEKK
jgi:hypothetical protein